MSAEDTQVYGIGLYDSRDEIVPGTWGYMARSYDPLDISWGPDYKPTTDEIEIAREARRLFDEEMLAPTAPRTLEELLALANPNLEDPSLKLERERIIGGEIHFTDLGEGQSGTIEDFRVERIAIRGSELEEPGLVFFIKDRTWFDPDGDHVVEASAKWSFALSRISDYQFGDSGHPTGITFKDLPRGGTQYVISRGHRDPRVQEAIDRERAHNGNPVDKLQQSIDNGDYDPRLASFLGQVASES
ncbi:MAG TPA: hypothetical protein VMR34_05270 [Candidatus Saccharimonadales bacterium]|nr:hypothetical protein [Candidatus Saccharimonadales bacterium]